MSNKMPDLNKPSHRKLRGYAFDPSLSNKMETATINEIVYKVHWEDLQNTAEEKLKKEKNDAYQIQGPGPIGEYIEVIDYDPTVQKYFKQVDLNHPYILAADGLDPSESNPFFHQQMVYAVTMTTIKNFESALGRKIIWAPHRVKEVNVYEEYVQRLRIYPHALREPNAYYSPQKKALLFGYFSAAPTDKTEIMPDSLVFTCLSHDIIAHEVTHAILDGMHRFYNEPSNPDVLAFHEAFADIVALFQHFTFPEVLKHQVAKTRGDLESQNLLGELAQQFGAAIGSYGSLRNAIGEVDPKTKKWKPKEPSPEEYATVIEPHARGSILVAAVFEAFITIYKDRAADLLRIASNGSGILPQGALHPDLVNRLAGEASKAARHVLIMCVRALDYCPPVDITFGDYLRAIITADADLVTDDNKNYRLAFIDSFRKRGIYPRGIKSLSVESLRFKLDSFISNDTKELFKVVSEFLKEYRNEVIYENDRQKIFNISTKYISDRANGNKGLHQRLYFKFENSLEYEKLTGLLLNPNVDREALGIRTSNAYGGNAAGPSFQIQNLRMVSRVGPEGNQVNQILFSILQRSGVIAEDEGFKHYVIGNEQNTPPRGFEMRGGCTMIFDLDTLTLKYAISKPLLDLEVIDKGVRKIDYLRAEQQYTYQAGEGMMSFSEYHKYFGMDMQALMNEPFALLHQH